MPRIDKQMQTIYQTCTQQSSTGGGMVLHDEAVQLMKRAEEINESPSSCYTSKSRDSLKGNKYLLNLMNDNKSRFSPESQQAIHQYIKTGFIPNGVNHSPAREDPMAGRHGAIRPDDAHNHLRPSDADMRPSGGASMPHSPVAGAHHHNPAIRPSTPITSGISNHYDMSRANSPAMPNAGVFGPRPSTPGVAGNGGHHPMRPSSPALPATPELPNAARPNIPVAPELSGRPGNGPVLPHSGIPAGPSAPAGAAPGAGVPAGNVAGPGVVLDFKAKKSTWHCHWFPMQERRPGGDRINNLFAKDGCLDKLDRINGRGARDYEFAKNRKPMEAGSSFSWWGHCNNAAEAACILQAPRHNVTLKGLNGESVTFTPTDIQGLLVKVTPGLINKVDFRGNRFNVAERDNPNDPSPEMFMAVLQEWAKEGLPFVLDVDPGQQVWNYPYDQVRIVESERPPEGFNPSSLIAGHRTFYYHAEMSGTGYDDLKRNYEFYIQKDEAGKVLSSGWIKTGNTDKNPDFMWRPHPIGNLNKREDWKLSDEPTNPHVDPQLVYDIYTSSIA